MIADVTPYGASTNPNLPPPPPLATVPDSPTEPALVPAPAPPIVQPPPASVPVVRTEVVAQSDPQANVLQQPPIAIAPPPASTSPTAQAGDVHAAAVATQDAIRQGRFFAQTDGALTGSASSSSSSLAVSLTAAGGYLLTSQLALGAKVVWTDSGAGSSIGGGAFANYYLSIGNPRLIPSLGGGITVYSTSANDRSQAGFLVDFTGQLHVFITDAVAIVPYATVALGNLYGEPTVQFQLGWALAVYF
jgi:hypothetical protein